jgi:hypothetical protein
MASAYFGAQNCADPTSTSCNAAAFLDDADTDCGLCCTAGGTLPLSVIRDEIVNRQRPVALQIEKPGVVGHVVLVVGCIGDMLDIHDPRADHVQISFAALQAGYDGGTWTRSFYKFGAIDPASEVNA